MKWQERQMSKTVPSGKWFVTRVLVLSLLACHLSLSAEQPQELTELEALQGENLQLRYDSIDKQMRLMQAQYQQLQAQQARIIRQLQELEGEVLEKRELKPGEWNVNWAKKTVREISHSNTANAEKTLEKKQ